MPAAQFNVVPVVLLLLVGVRLVRRFRRNVGRQPLRPKRMIMRITIYAALALFFGAVSLVLVPNMSVFAGLLGGLVLGGALGLYGLHLTRFETTPEGRFYTPNPYMGVGLSMLLLARLLYRVAVVSSAVVESPKGLESMQSPLTYFLFGLLAGYYIAYFIGVLARHGEK